MEKSLENRIFEFISKTDMSYSDISKKFGISQSKVSAIAQDHNFKRETKAEKTWKMEKVLVEELKKNKLNYYEIAEKYDISVKELCKIAKKNKIKKSLKDIKKLKEKSSLEKYGTKHPLQNKEVQKRQEETNLKKYGVKHPAQNKNIQEKTKQYFNDKYGCDNPFQNKEIKEKIRLKNLKNFGVENVNYSKEIQRKREQHNLEKWGSKYTTTTQNMKDKTKETIHKKYGEQYDSIFAVPEIRKKSDEKIKERYGVDHAYQLPQVKQGFSNDSKPNKLFAKKLDNLGIKYEREFALDKYLYDFKVNEDILVEINPTATHNTVWHPFNKTILKEQHKNKSETAIKNGYHCIHIWEWDNEDKIIDLFLKNRKRIYARDCELNTVDKQMAYNFIQENHLQSYANCELALGLYYKDELVEIMTFGKPRYNKNYDWEIIRLCSNCNVIGGAEKIFSYFRSKCKGSIISYCDSSKFNGEIYKKLGFTLQSEHIGKHWYNIKTRQHITDNLLRQRGYDQLFNANYGKGTSNEELMLKAGFVTVYDSGQQTWVLK